MKKFLKGTIITTTAFLLFLGGMSAVTPVVPENETGIATDTGVIPDDKPEVTPGVQPTSDHPSRDEKKEPLS